MGDLSSQTSHLVVGRQHVLTRKPLQSKSLSLMIWACNNVTMMWSWSACACGTIVIHHKLPCSLFQSTNYAFHRIIISAIVCPKLNLSSWWSLVAGRLCMAIFTGGFRASVCMCAMDLSVALHWPDAVHVKSACKIGYMWWNPSMSTLKEFSL